MSATLRNKHRNVNHCAVGLVLSYFHSGKLTITIRGIAQCSIVRRDKCVEVIQTKFHSIKRTVLL